MENTDIELCRKFVGLLKQESITIDVGCGEGVYEYVAVEDIDYVFDELIKRERDCKR